MNRCVFRDKGLWLVIKYCATYNMYSSQCMQYSLLYSYLLNTFSEVKYAINVAHKDDNVNARTIIVEKINYSEVFFLLAR